MRKVKRWVSMSVFACMVIASSAMAYDFLLNPSSQQVGAVFGEYIVVKEDDVLGKFISSSGSGRIGEIELPINASVSTGFEIVIYVDWNEFNQSIVLHSDTSELTIRFGGSFPSIYFNGGLFFSDSAGWQWNHIVNNLKLSVEEGVASLYINGNPHPTKITLDNSISYTNLVINGIKEKDRLFEVKSNNVQLISSPAKKPYQDILNPSSYQAGETLGENLIVGEDVIAGKYIKSSAGRLGEIELPINVSVSTGFEIVVYADWNEFTQSIILHSDTSELKIRFGGSFPSIYFNDGLFFSDDAGWQWNDFINNLKLTVKGDKASLYINGNPHPTKITLDNPNLNYTSLLISGIKEKDRLFEIKGLQSGIPPIPTNVIWDIDGNKKWSLPDIIYGLQVLTGVRIGK